jgi:dephospho-CoA kinase
MIIGLSGYARAGKDTVADYLVKEHGYKRISFADPIKKAMYALDPIVQAGDDYTITLQEAVDKLGWEQAKNWEEVRRLLQVFGTEVGREMFGEYIWINKALGNAEPFDKIVVTDVRFPEEARAIRNLFGEVWRIERGKPTNDHVSENALMTWNFDVIFPNLGTIDDLTSKIGDYLQLYFPKEKGVRNDTHN